MLTREELDTALDRSISPLSDRIEKLSDTLRDAGVDFAAHRADLIELTRKVGRLHEKTTAISEDMVAYKAVSKADGRVVRVRDVTLVGISLGTAYAVLHTLLKVL